MEKVQCFQDENFLLYYYRTIYNDLDPLYYSVVGVTKKE